MSTTRGGVIERADTAARGSFPRQARLTKPTEFKKVFSNPAVSSDAWFKVLARRNGGTGARLGLVVSRQVDRRAVARNRIKRVVRESFRSYFSDAGPAYDFVVLPRRESVTISNRRLRISLDRHWARVLERSGEPAERR